MRRHRSYRRFLASVALLAAGLSGCELLGDTSLPPYEEITDISYVRHVQVLFSDKCTQCHDGTTAELNLRSWAGLLVGYESGGAVIPFDPDRSALTRILPAHPVDRGGSAVTEAELEFLKRWIAGGARHDDGSVPYADARQPVVVAVPSEGYVAVVDPGRMAIARILDFETLGFGAGAEPRHLAAQPDGGGWFVSLVDQGAVLRFDRSHALTGLAEVSPAGRLSVSSAGDWLVVGGTEATVHSVETVDMRVRVIPGTFPSLLAAGIRPQGDVGYTVSSSADQLMAFPIPTGQPSHTGIGGPTHEMQKLLVTRDGGTLVGLGSASGRAVRFMLSAPLSPLQDGDVTFPEGVVDGWLGDAATLAVVGQAGGVYTAPLDGSTPPQLIGRVVDGRAIAGAGDRVLVGTGEGRIAVFGPGATSPLRLIALSGVPSAMASLSETAPTTSGHQ